MKEADIRPAEVFDRYLELAEEDVKTFFDLAALHRLPCPACGADGNFAFEKSGFHYRECPDCLTLFVSPRPEKQAFEAYYRESQSSRYWATTFYKVTEEARREKLWKPKAALVKEKILSYAEAGCTVVDIGGGYGIFAEEMCRIWDGRVVVVEPAPPLADVCREKNLNIKECFLEDLPDHDLPAGGKCFTSFELVEHLPDPGLFFRRLESLMEPGDLFVFTTLSGTGVDIQALWNHSKSVHPPHHLNFFNPSSIGILLSAVGLKMLEVTTPGQLDLDIMLNQRDAIQDRFWRNFVRYADEEQRSNMQEFVAKNLLSSHMMVVSRKGE